MPWPSGNVPIVDPDQRSSDPLRLAREVDAGARAEAEALYPLREARLAELLSQRDRPDVGRPGDDLVDRHPLRAALVRVVDRAVGDLELVGERERGAGRDEPL